MEKLDMQTKNLADEKFEALKQLFPNAVTETMDDAGEVVRAVDKDILMQEIATCVVEGRDERYQFTWPDKRQAILAANAPLSKTLRPVREESVNFDDTENLYIEGDNLDVLKLLQETYLGKIKMIYIDPPYNKGGDFVYKDDFKQSAEEYIEASGQYDEEGNRLEKNIETNGRFHTDWLNMIYPRLKLARNLLSDDGVIFISIDDNEQENLKKVCDEIFGEGNFIANIVRNTNSSKNQSLFISVNYDYALVYAKNNITLSEKHTNNKWQVKKNNVEDYVKKVKFLKKSGLSEGEIVNELKQLTKYPRFIDFMNYWYLDERGVYSKADLGGVKNGNMTPIINPLTGKEDPIPPGGFRYKLEKMEELVADNRIHFHEDGSLPRLKRYLNDNLTQTPKGIMSDDQRPDDKLLKSFNTPFSNPKQLEFINRIVSISDNDSIILDFFSGSATTAHAVMDLNAEDGGNRKYILVQLPEETDEKSEAYKAGYKTICDIGKERIRRAGQKIVEEHKDKESIEDLDIGFRVLKIDSSNMKDVYYEPDMTEQGFLDSLENNIKEDRSPEDLLFQVMLDLGIPLSADIQVETIGGKDVYVVEGGFFIACFDAHVGDEVVKAIAEKKPYYAVFRDASMARDSVATNFDQIFESISPETVRRVL